MVVGSLRLKDGGMTALSVVVGVMLFLELIVVKSERPDFEYPVAGNEGIGDRAASWIESEETLGNETKFRKSSFVILQDTVEEMEEEMKKLGSRLEGIENGNLIDRLDKMESEMKDIQELVDAFRDRRNQSRMLLLSDQGTEDELSLKDLHSKFSRLHESHAEEIKKLQGHHDRLKSSVSGLHEQVSHISKMHNITEHLKNTAELILQERWYEASLQWSFNENHIVHDPNIEANEVISRNLREVVRFAYVRDGPMYPNETTREERDARVRRLVPIFKFVHKLSFNEYKVYAYQTFIQQLLSDEVFDGSEIFILAHYVRKNYGLNSKGHRHLPPITTTVAGGSNVKILYLDAMGEEVGEIGSEGEGEEEDVVRRRRAGGGSRVKAVEDDSGSAERDIGNVLEVHVKGDVVGSRKEAHKSFRYPVYGSKPGSYRPYNSGAWAFSYRENGYFVIKNSINQGYLNVRNEEAGVVNTVPDLDTDVYNVEFKIVLIDHDTFGIESRKFASPLRADSCEKANEVGKVGDPGVGEVGRRICFSADTEMPKESMSSDRRDWAGAKFTVRNPYEHMR